jgi:hypothetical protein
MHPIRPTAKYAVSFSALILQSIARRFLRSSAPTDGAPRSSRGLALGTQPILSTAKPVSRRIAHAALRRSRPRRPPYDRTPAPTEANTGWLTDARLNPVRHSRQTQASETEALTQAARETRHDEEAMTTEHDDLTEADLDHEERAALKLARLPEAKLRKLSDEKLRKAHDAATDIFGPGEFLSEEDRLRVLKVGGERHVTRPPRPTKTKKHGNRYREDGYVKL